MQVSPNGSRLRAVAEREIAMDAPEPATTPSPNRMTLEAAGLQMVLLGLKALSQRFIVAISAFATVAALGSVWYLFNQALPTDPSTHQLIGLSLYGSLVLAVLWVRK